MSQTNPERESTAEREGIVDQQDAVLEKLHEPEPKADPETGPTEGDPMDGEAPTG
jgi:hypothetical protein